MNVKQITELALGEYVETVGIRRHLHSHPELSFEERATSEFIAGQLTAAGIAFESIAGTGIIAVINGELEDREPHETVVLRADMDALPIREANMDLAYRSIHDGVMHACGHDIHTSILVGTLKILSKHRNRFGGTVLGLFQPGEELNPGGASIVLSENPFEGYDIKAFIGEHVEPELPTGVFGFRAGKYMASNDELRFTVKGKGGHAALRDNIIDPVEASASLISKLYGIPAHNPDKELPAILSIGKVTAMGATNVVPDSVYMEGTMRTFDESWRNRMKELIHEAADSIDAGYGVETLTDISKGYPCVVNDENLTALAKSTTKKMFGDKSCVNLGMRPTSEDFGFYTQVYPSVFYRIGVGGEGGYLHGKNAGRLHTPTFCPDEKAMGYGMALFTALVFEILGTGIEV